MIGSRTSRAGQKVCILERGQERWPGEYPNTFGTLMENAQVRSAVAPQLGSRDAFFDFRLEDGNEFDKIVLRSTLDRLDMYIQLIEQDFKLLNVNILIIIIYIM